MYQRKQQMLPPPRHHIRMDGLWAVSTTVAIGTTMLRDDGRMRGVTRGTPKRCRATHLGHVVCFFLSFLHITNFFFRYNALIFQQPPQPNNEQPTQPNVKGCNEDEQRGDEQRQWGARDATRLEFQVCFFFFFLFSILLIIIYLQAMCTPNTQRPFQMP